MREISGTESLRRGYGPLPFHCWHTNRSASCTPGDRSRRRARRAAGRFAFAQAVARHLVRAGFVAGHLGSADTCDSPGERARLGLPRLSLGEAARPV